MACVLLSQNTPHEPSLWAPLNPDHRPLVVPTGIQSYTDAISGVTYDSDRVLLCSCGATFKLLPQAEAHFVIEDHVYRIARGWKQ